MTSLARLHASFGFVALAIVLLAVVTGWAPTTDTRSQIVPNVRENPASYRPVYVPRTSRGGTSGRSTGGGFGSGK